MAIKDLDLVAQQTTHKARPKVNKPLTGLEKTTKITSDYLIWNGRAIFIKEDKPYFTVISDDPIPDFTGPSIYSKTSEPVYLGSAEADKYMSRDDQNMLIKLVKTTKEALNKKSSISFMDSTGGKFLNGAEIVIGGNEYIACYKGSPVQYDKSGFYYIFKEKVKFDGLTEIVEQKSYLSDSEIEYINSHEAQVARYSTSLASRSGNRTEADQKLGIFKKYIRSDKTKNNNIVCPADVHTLQTLQTIRDKAHSKEIMGYISTSVNNAYMFVKKDENGCFCQSGNQRIDLGNNQVETHPVYWDAEKEKFYYLDKRLDGLWTIKRYIPENCEELITENKKI